MTPATRRLIELALDEDLGRGDVTSEAIFAPGAPARGTIIAKGRPPLVPRQFSSLDTAGQYVRDLGIGKVTVELDKWSPGQKQLAVG